MNNINLLEYFINNDGPGIHKWLHYFDVYENIFEKYRNTPITFLEIGVQNGGSALMWKKYFGDSAKIIGVDIDEKCKDLEKYGIEVWIGDQEDPKFWQDFLSKNDRINIILDDGGHTMKQQIQTFESLFPVLSNDGLYVCEDTHTSYFSTFGGSTNRDESTFIEYIKKLIDSMHGWYNLPIEELKTHYMSKNIKSIQFYDSIVAIHKKRNNIPTSLFRGYATNHNIPSFMSFLDLRRSVGVKD